MSYSSSTENHSYATTTRDPGYRGLTAILIHAEVTASHAAG